MTRASTFVATAIITLCIPAAGVFAHPAWGIVVDHQNQIYFSDLETIWKIDAQGKLTVFRAGVSGRHTHEISLGNDGNLYGVDNAYEPATQRFIAALWKMTPAGEFSYVLSPTDNPPKAMTNWKDRGGNTYYVGQENGKHDFFVLKRTPDGNVTTLGGDRKAGDGYRQVVLYSVGGMAFGPDDMLYFTANSSVWKITVDGKMARLAGNVAANNAAESPGPQGRETRLFGLVVDTQGNAFVAGHGNRGVLKITPDGKSTTVITAEKPWAPTGVAWKDGNLYVLEFGFTPPSTYTPRVRKLSADGQITVLSNGGEVQKSSVQTSFNGNVATILAPERRAPYVLLAAGAGIVGLAVVGWLVRKRKFHHQHQGN